MVITSGGPPSSGPGGEIKGSLGDGCGT